MREFCRGVHDRVQWHAPRRHHHDIWPRQPRRISRVRSGPGRRSPLPARHVRSRRSPRTRRQHITGDDVRAQAERVINLEEELGPCKLAIVVPTPLAFGYARMYELHTAETQVHSRVVYTRKDGLAWLDAKREAQERGSTEEALDVWEAGSITECQRGGPQIGGPLQPAPAVNCRTAELSFRVLPFGYKG